MAAGDTTQGRRRHDLEGGTLYPEHFEPGDYWHAGLDGGTWASVVPVEGAKPAVMTKHDVTEHEDGTITVSPSILHEMPGAEPVHWHGFLERGVWREV